jgi:DNA-binding NarL/FixJ family response regulator
MQVRTCDLSPRQHDFFSKADKICLPWRSLLRPGRLTHRTRWVHRNGLTSREQEVAGLVCDGRSNQEIAENARLSMPMVKKHLHAAFRKLEVPSRSRLMTLMR